MRKFKCLSNQETDAHIAWSKYFKVGEVYDEIEFPSGMEMLGEIVKLRCDSLALGFDADSPMPMIVPSNQFEELK